jgi:FKBP-type peptidyl-prolyl cis-trans isomerase SlyD
MSSPDTVADQKVVTIHYTLTNDAGETLDSSEGNDPMAYLHGAHNIVPGLESELVGKSVGDELQVVVAPADGYGERVPQMLEVERSSFPEDAELVAGMQFVAETEDGMVPLWVDHVDGDKVHVDPNHPLAGENLHFKVSILELRDASAEEIEHGHPHGPGGHDH